MDKINLIADIFLIIFVIIALVIMLGLICSSFIAAYISEKKYRKSVIKILKSKCDYEKIKKQINRIFDTYRTRYFSYLNIEQLNLRLIDALHDDKIENCNEKEIVEYCDILSKFNEDFNEERFFSDEKLNDLLLKTEDDLLKKDIKSMFLCINSYNDGRLYEKETEINKLVEEKSKMGKQRTVSFLVGAVGFISSIITIVSAFI